MRFLANPQNLAFFSSVGPTADGRIKPDLCAPGYYVFSASAGSTSCGLDGLRSSQGTSMATPVVAGTAALARQYFTDGHYDGGVIAKPSAALLRAVLINSAIDMTGDNVWPRFGCCAVVCSH